MNTVGSYVRREVIPAGMSVKEAAERLGVGRPALSNLLNGKAALSPEMALRLATTFGADRDRLLGLQAQADRESLEEKDKSVVVRAYVPPFLTIKSRHIQDWAETNLEARTNLAVLLRKLIHSTGRDLRRVDLPGYDDAERKGWDGVVEAGAATPWIPEGKSGWEFGVNKNPQTKAEGDYVTRLASVTADERADTTFVFVTPRKWPGKDTWAHKKNAAGEWRAVKVLDASNLEQWLEQSIPAQIWLAEKLELPISGFETLDRCWERWAAASQPQLTPAIFEAPLSAHRKGFLEWLGKESDRPFVVAADSKDEALAFLYCLFQEQEVPLQHRGHAVVFESAQALRKLASSSAPFIAIVATDEVERELPALYRSHHCIAVHRRNAVNSAPDITLDLLRHDSFEKALATMGIVGPDVDRLARESGRSPTVLRRRLSKIDAIRTPRWTTDGELAKKLIPLALVGAWNAAKKGDQELVSALGECPYGHIEEAVARLTGLDDAPVWSTGQFRGVTSKIDALFAISASITAKDLSDFFLLSEYVLSESDPALDLPEDQRWAAGLHGKLRDHSPALRNGIRETLVALAVHGNGLFKTRIGIDVDGRVSALIRGLLTPLTLDRLRSHERDLPHYAEAAPDAFLGLLEADLKQPQPALFGLLQPASTGILGNCPRTGLLWALECLAWNPQHLPRVVDILGHLSRTPINDNWANKPVESLAAIYRSWLPQTAASLEDREKALELLVRRHPEVGWRICTEQLSHGDQFGAHSYRPRWRNDAAGVGGVTTHKEIFAFRRKALELALGWPAHDEKTLGDLVACLEGIPPQDRGRVWDMVDAWSNRDQTTDHAKALLRERIRSFALTRRSLRRDLEPATRDRARDAYERLEPRDLTTRHAWLFVNAWVEESADELEDEQDWSKRDERIQALRTAAVQEIWSERGFEGIRALLAGDAPFVVGHHASACVTTIETRTDFVRQCLGTHGDLERKADLCLQGFLGAADTDTRSSILTTVASGLDKESLIRLFKSAPFASETWRRIDDSHPEIRDRYWAEIAPTWNRHTELELNELVDRLLDAKRPRAAFHVVHMEWPHIETSRLKRLLNAVATVDMEPSESHHLSAHDISEALDSLDGRPDVTRDEMAQLELRFIKALDDTGHGIRNLERQIAESPAMFAQSVVLLHKRTDGGEDPPDWKIEDTERHTVVFSAIYRLLNQIKRIPGTTSDGQIAFDGLHAWLARVRELCAQYGRSEIGDEWIGQLLSRGPLGSSGMWPCRPICEAMERIASPVIARGFEIGTLNARGVHWRGEGGSQERELSAKYRGWSQKLRFDYPYVASILEAIAASYDRDAAWQDSEARVERRLRS